MRRLFALAGLCVACGGSSKPLYGSDTYPEGQGPAAGIPTYTPGGSAALTPSEISARAVGSIVVVTAGERRSAGFVAGPQQVATTLHGIRGAERITVRTARGTELAVSWIVTYDEKNDLAILAVPEVAEPSLPLGAFDRVRPGDPVTVLGHPMGLEASVSVGVVAGVRAFSDGVELLQVTAAISPGSSGGPILNDRGEVIGVTRLLLRNGQALNFGASVDALRKMLFAHQPGIALRAFADRTATFEKPEAPKDLTPSKRGGTRPFPESVIGFRFASNPSEAGAVCGDEYTLHAPDNPGRLLCSYVPARPEGLPDDSEVLLDFTAGKLVEVTFEVEFRFSELLAQRYGPPMETYVGDAQRHTRAIALKNGQPGGMVWYLDHGTIGFYRSRTGYVVNYSSDLRTEIQSQAY